MNKLNDLLNIDSIPDKVELSPKDQKILLLKYKSLVLENLRNQAYWKSTNENIEKVTIELDKANKKLKELSLTDSLTNLRNRRYFEEVICEYEKNFLERKTIPEVQDRKYSLDNVVMGIVLIDIDYFKKINDNYGHKAGDKVLVKISSLLKSLIRFDDTCIRWGGEEFLIILNNTQAEYLPHFADKCRKLIKNNNFEINKDLSINLSVSMGYIAHPFYCKKPRNLTFEQTIILCDHVLYIAKNIGRNRSIGIIEGKISTDFSNIMNLLERIDYSKNIETLENNYFSIKNSKCYTSKKM